MFLSASLLLGTAALYAMTPVPQPPMVVTASRTHQSLDQVPASVTLITRAEIEASQAAGVLDLLRLQAGIEFSRTGGAGHQTSLFLRGTEANHVLVLIDGVRVNSVQTGAFGWAHLMLSQIERIEILRGPAAAFYGSDAIGGVIQIFTRRPGGPTAHVEAGSYETYGVSAGLGGGDGVRYHVMASRRETGGFSAQNEQGFAYHPDDDGYKNTSLSAGVAVPAGGGLLSLDGRHTEGEVEFDQGVTGITAQSSNATFDSGDHKLQVAAARSQRETPAFDSGFESERFSVDWQFQQAFEAALWTVGFNYTHEDGESYSLTGGDTQLEGRRDNFGVYAGLRYPFGDFTAEAALRYDRNSTFGGHATGEATLAWQLSGATQVWASYGTGFRAPNFSELFSPGFGGLFAGNPNLEPETSRSLELAVEHQFNGNQELSVNAYATRIDGLIAFQGENFRAINVAEAAINGLAFRYHWEPPDWRVTANLTLQETEDESTGKSLLRRAEEKFTVTLDRVLAGGGNIGVEAIYHGERLDIRDTRLDAYTLVNLRLGWPLNDTWTLTGRIENLLDEDYALTAGFNTPGRSAYLGVTWRP